MPSYLSLKFSPPAPQVLRNFDSGCLDVHGRKVWRMRSKLFTVVMPGSGSVEWEVLEREEKQEGNQGPYLDA